MLAANKIQEANRWQVVWGELVRSWIELRRYWFNTIGGLVSLYLLFLLLFLGTSLLTQRMTPSGEGSLEWLIGGYIIWSLAVFAYMSPAGIVTQGAREGTLEQMALSPWGLGWVMTGILLAKLLNDIVVTGLLLAVALLTSGQSLALPWGKVALLMVVVSLQGYAMGWAIAGLALNFKRIQSIYTLLQFSFIAALAVPWELQPLARLIPLRWPYYLMQGLLKPETEVASWSLEMIGCLLLSIGYLGLGWAVFNRSLQWARQMGHLGHY